MAVDALQVRDVILKCQNYKSADEGHFSFILFIITVSLLQVFIDKVLTLSMVGNACPKCFAWQPGPDYVVVNIYCCFNSSFSSIKKKPCFYFYAQPCINLLYNLVVSKCVCICISHCIVVIVNTNIESKGKEISL